MKIAILDDYQNISLKFADWNEVHRHAEVTVFNDNIKNEDDVIKRLLPFDIICVMRERTPLTKSIISIQSFHSLSRSSLEQIRKI